MLFMASDAARCSPARCSRLSVGFRPLILRAFLQITRLKRMRACRDRRCFRDRAHRCG